MIAFLPNCGFLSEVSRAIAIAEALRARGEAVVFAARGGPYAHLVEAAGFPLTRLAPELDAEGCRAFLGALLSMGRTNEPFFSDDELAAAVDAEVAFLRGVGARAVVVGFTLSAYLSSRVAKVPLVTDHGGIFLPPVLAAGLCPEPVNPPSPGMARLPRWAQRWIANRVPALVKAPVAQLDRHAKRLGVEGLPNMLALMCGDLTLVTELPEHLGLRPERATSWTPRWPFRVRSGTTFRWTGPLYARLDLPVPPDVEAFLASDEPVVYVCPTSVTEPFLRELVAGVAATGARVLVGATLHSVADLAGPRTLVAGVLPNHRILPRVAAAVLMGGQGSVQTALASGTPFVGLPLHGEQELNVAMAERLGAALRLSPTLASTPALTAAVRRLLTEPAFAEAARRAAARSSAVDGAARAAEAILDHVGVGTARSARPERAAPVAPPPPG